MKEKFCDLYSERTKERIAEASREREVRPVFRLIRHSPDLPITKEDFYPTIMISSGLIMPPYAVQDRKTEIGQFGVSLFLTIEQLKKYVDFVPSERNKEAFPAIGSINSKYGSASETGPHGHVNYFLFDPVNLNCFEMFDKVHGEY